MWRRTREGWGYSPLDQIDRDNVGDLRMVWTRALAPGLPAGETRRVVTGIPGKTGVVYTLDRETGEFLSATPTVPQNVITDIDGATGAVTPNGEIVFTAEGQEVLACPSWFGAKDWEAGAYSLLTNTMYTPCTTSAPGSSPRATPAATTRWPSVTRSRRAWTRSARCRAISTQTGESRWLHSQRSATMSLVATGSGLVFGGDVNGRFRAFDQETGEVLWEINLGSAVTSFPISYAVDGRQYVAVGTGSAGTASGFLGLTPELRPSAGNNLFVFALP